MCGKGRWLLEEPTSGVSGTEWADAYETIKGLMVEFVDEYDNSANVDDRMVVFALEDTLQRCALEAKSRESWDSGSARAGQHRRFAWGS